MKLKKASKRKNPLKSLRKVFRNFSDDLLCFQDEDKKAGGISLDRYKELYAQFIGNPDENHPAC